MTPDEYKIKPRPIHYVPEWALTGWALFPMLALIFIKYFTQVAVFDLVASVMLAVFFSWLVIVNVEYLRHPEPYMDGVLGKTLSMFGFMCSGLAVLTNVGIAFAAMTRMF